jgi:hypothetical protein
MPEPSGLSLDFSGQLKLGYAFLKYTRDMFGHLVRQFGGPAHDVDFI